MDGYVSTALFRIFQEALTNISRHAAADYICIKIIYSVSGELQMIITDNGIGLPDDYMNKNYSLGIVGMIERTGTINGHFQITRAPQGGTEVVVKVPLYEKQDKSL